jgi:hypothetical protein
LACHWGNGAGTAPWAWAHVPEGGGGDDVRRGCGGADQSEPDRGEVRGGSPPGSLFCDNRVVERHGRG